MITRFAITITDATEAAHGCGEISRETKIFPLPKEAIAYLRQIQKCKEQNCIISFSISVINDD